MSGPIRIRRARQQNLKNLDLDVRSGEMTVVAGPSSSGKSSLVFDTPPWPGDGEAVRVIGPWAPSP